MTESRKVRNSGASATVLEYLDKHPNQVLYLKDIAEDTNLPQVVVQRSIARIRYGNVANAQERLVVESSGHVWLWKSAKPKSPDNYFVQVYASPTGLLLAEDENGALYKLVRIE